MPEIRRSFAALGAVILAGLPGWPAMGQPVVVNDVMQASAIVESVDQKARMVLLRGEHGELDTIIAGPEVRNLAQLRPGDHVMVRAHQSLAVELSKTGGPMGATAEVAVDRAQPGMRPAGSRTTTMHMRVQVVATDPDHATISVIGPERIARVLHIADPRLLAFARSLQPGDEVDVTYTLGVAVSVVPAQG